jgi:hypothetical protein
MRLTSCPIAVDRQKTEHPSPTDAGQAIDPTELRKEQP